MAWRYLEALARGGRVQVSARAALLGALLAAGCATGPGESRFRRHFDGEVWTGAVAEQWQDPWNAVPEATFLATSLALIPYDNDIQRNFSQQNPSSNAALPGDILQYCAIGVPLAWGGITWAKGDKGEQLETSAEALAATGLSTYLLKSITNRERPDGSGSDSFPSGHTSAAFCGATLLADFIEKDTASHSKLGYLFYIPAAYVGVNRVYVDKHWATDVAAGAFLSTFLTNLIFDAHYGDEKRDHEGIFKPDHEAHWSIGPDVEDHRTGIVFHLDF